MNAFKDKTIVIGITGGIAGYKILDLITLLKQKGAHVRVIMTYSALQLFEKKEFEEITGSNVYTNLFEKEIPYSAYTKKGRKIPHIELADTADIFLIAPASANILAKVAHGEASDLLTTTLLATNAPVIFAPSMNVKMLKNPATQKNIETIKSFGYSIIDPDFGDLACGYRGEGRLANTEKIMQFLTAHLAYGEKLQGKKVLVTAGGTVETIDPIRVITNNSSGKMGKALAECAFRMGAKVVLLHGKNAVTSPYLFDHTPFTTGKDLAEKMKLYVKHMDIVIHTAAVGDFVIENKSDKKIDSTKDILLKLTPAGKVVEQIKLWKKDIFLVAFKAEYTVTKKVLIEKAVELLRRSNADLVVANDAGKKGVGFEADTNAVTIIDKEGKTIEIPLMRKEEVAEKIWENILRAQSRSL